MKIVLTVSFLLESYENTAIIALVKAGYKVSTFISIKGQDNLASYTVQFFLENDIRINDIENSQKEIKKITMALNDTKYYAIVYRDDFYSSITPSNILIIKKPKIKREVPYLKVLESKKEEKLEN
jgi:hypothetical protein